MADQSPPQENNELDEMLQDFLHDYNHGLETAKQRGENIEYHTFDTQAAFLDRLKEWRDADVKEARIDERENMKFIQSDGTETYIPFNQYRYTGDGLLLSWEDRTAQLQPSKDSST